jgi:hypothetical protein
MDVSHWVGKLYPTTLFVSITRSFSDYLLVRYTAQVKSCRHQRWWGCYLLWKSRSSSCFGWGIKIIRVLNSAVYPPPPNFCILPSSLHHVFLLIFLFIFISHFFIFNSVKSKKDRLIHGAFLFNWKYSRLKQYEESWKLKFRVFWDVLPYS